MFWNFQRQRGARRSEELFSQWFVTLRANCLRSNFFRWVCLWCGCMCVFQFYRNLLGNLLCALLHVVPQSMSIVYRVPPVPRWRSFHRVNCRLSTAVLALLDFLENVSLLAFGIWVRIVSDWKADYTVAKKSSPTLHLVGHAAPEPEKTFIACGSCWFKYVSIWK